MTLAADLTALETIERLAGKLLAGLAELDRRARIPSTPDGMPKRASGAQPSSRPTRPNPTISTFIVAAEARPRWSWACSCGVIGHQLFMPPDGYDSSHEALQGGQTHYEAVHGDFIPGTGYTDTTGESGTTHSRPDEVTQRRRTTTRKINEALRAIETAATQLDDPKAVDEGGPWCDSCARIKHDDGTPYLSISHTTTRTDVGGRLKEPAHLCRWCYDHVRREVTGPNAYLPFGEATPPRDDLRHYLTRGRAPRKAAQ